MLKGTNINICMWYGLHYVHLNMEFTKNLQSNVISIENFMISIDHHQARVK